MPRIEEPIRRRRGGGTRGISGDPGGFYQRRQTEDKLYWPEFSPEGSENRQEKNEETKKKAGVTSGDCEPDTGTTTKSNESLSIVSRTEKPVDSVGENDGTGHSETRKIETRMKPLNRRNNRKRKRSFTRLSSTTFPPDDDFSLTTKPQTKQIDAKLKAVPSSTPKGSTNVLKQTRAPLVTPATLPSCSETDPKQRQQLSASPHLEQSKSLTEKLEETIPITKDLEKDSRQQKHIWESPQSSPLLANKSAAECKIQQLMEQIEQQKRQMQKLKDENAERDKYIQQLETDAKTAGERKQAAVNEAEERQIFLRQEDNRAHRQQVDEFLREMEEIEHGKVQEIAAHNLRLQMMSQSVIEMSGAQREMQAENLLLSGRLDQTEQELRVTRETLRTCQDRVRILQSQVHLHSAELKQQKEEFERREMAMAQQRCERHDDEAGGQAQQLQNQQQEQACNLGKKMPSSSTSDPPLSSTAALQIKNPQKRQIAPLQRTNRQSLNSESSGAASIQANVAAGHPLSFCSSSESAYSTAKSTVSRKSRSKRINKRLKPPIPSFDFMGMDIGVSRKKKSSQKKEKLIFESG